ncbi:serine/threonine-protein kinase [Spongiactinospora sp. TRM90649]|uniref:serine/threonine-protein kinase n=1 Tax=Spongiactinospora sp. TRM90649 TaxID=3031114 RepID=UPI0023F8DF53|nr:serine/threonine-protein kinase [Spongiactinospora sp. TRM90649]MDF5752497.1 serine/threonine-protein kinase [Spongiactinospora sp. TRM90649]
MNLVAGRYRLVAQLGQGGMGTVWRAVDELLRQEVAVKEVRLPSGLDQAARAELIERTLREARAAARLRSHPSIVTVLDVIMDGGRPWIVMELINGRSLDQILRQDGPLPPPRAAWVGQHILDALMAAHSVGVLHRDVKPANVLITEDGRVQLTDFGIATVAGDVALTQTGLLNGSPGYVAPERLRGDPDGPAADLWSLGATLYTVVEGAQAFSGDNAHALMAAVLMREPAPARRAGPLAPVLAALLEKDPERRCTAEQAALWLRSAARGDAPESVPGRAGRASVARRERGRARVARRRRAVLLGGTAAAALGVVAALLIWVNTRALPGDRLASPTATATPVVAASSAPVAARLFRTQPKTCPLLTNAQARALLGGTAKRTFLASTRCQWVSPIRATIMLTTYRTPTVKGCQANFDGMVTLAKDEKQRHPKTRLRAGRTAGHRTYAYTRVAPDHGAGFHRSLSVFCVTNVLVSVDYWGPRPGYTVVDRTTQHVTKALTAPH